MEERRLLNKNNKLQKQSNCRKYLRPSKTTNFSTKFIIHKFSFYLIKGKINYNINCFSTASLLQYNTIINFHGKQSIGIYKDYTKTYTKV